MAKIIAFGHRKETGKSTAAKLLSTHLRCENPELKIVDVSFAAKLKDVSFQLFGWAGLKRGVYYESHYKDKEIKLPFGLTPRDIWIATGNKMREIYSDVWIQCALNVDADFIIISDLRYRNEAAIIRRLSGTLICMNRDVPKGTDSAEIDLEYWDDWDAIIANNGTLNELSEQVIALVN